METLPAVEIPPFLTKQYRLKLIEQYYEAEYMKIIKVYYSATMSYQYKNTTALSMFKTSLEHLDIVTNNLKEAC